METVHLGRSGLEISRVVMGMMSFGSPGRGAHPWTLELETARPIVRRAYEAGVSSFDTSNNYSDGTSEEVTGVLLKEFGPRESVQIFTKVFSPVRESRNGHGLSRAAIMQEIDASLRRLGTDYVDLYQIHRFDHRTPIEETMEALHDVVKAGKARYIGASSMWAWQFAQLQHAAELRGWTKFISMQDQYNLLEREDEREMHPFCVSTGVGVIPWSPLARGRLTRPWGSHSSAREPNDEIGKSLYLQQQNANGEIVNAVGSIAKERGVSMAQIAFAWVSSRPAVSAPIVGATKVAHVDDVIAGLGVELTADEVSRLENSYEPRYPSGF